MLGGQISWEWRRWALAWWSSGARPRAASWPWMGRDTSTARWVFYPVLKSSQKLLLQLWNTPGFCPQLHKNWKITALKVPAIICNCKVPKQWVRKRSWPVLLGLGRTWKAAQPTFTLFFDFPPHAAKLQRRVSLPGEVRGESLQHVPLPEVRLVRGPEEERPSQGRTQDPPGSEGRLLPAEACVRLGDNQLEQQCWKTAWGRRPLPWNSSRKRAEQENQHLEMKMKPSV